VVKLTIGQLIKQSRLNRGLTQEELGELVGVKKSAVAKWENGRVSEIGRSNLQGLAKALGLDPADLIGEDGVEVRKRIKKDPKAAAAKAAELLSDQDFIDLYTLYKSLSQEKKNQIRDFILFIANQP
jgi:transcriptional regulator with XRE-family HTH domain